MPAAMERALKARAKKMGLGKGRAGAYVYGTMRKMGWKPGMKENSRDYGPVKARFLNSKRYQSNVGNSGGSSPVNEDYRFSKTGRGRQRPTLPSSPPANEDYRYSKGRGLRNRPSLPSSYADRKRALSKEAFMRRAKRRYKGPESPRGTQS